MIPKIIHYVWVGGKDLTPMALNCIESWKRFCPDYEIIEWNERNFDINSYQFTRDAHAAKKFAYVSDVIRLYALCHFGGIYMDVDVEVVKPLDDFLSHGAFSGFESVDLIPTGIIACEKNFKPFFELLNEYHERDFFNGGQMNLVPNTYHFTEYFKKHGLILNNQFQVVNGFALYPSEYFCPKNWLTKELNMTENTCTIHHFDGSWLTETEKKVSSLKYAYKQKFGGKWKVFFVLRYPFISFRSAVKKIKSKRVK